MAYLKNPILSAYRTKYRQSRAIALAQGMEWAMTFEDFVVLWDSHNWIGRKGLILCRTMHIGPYSKDNCYIDTRANYARLQHATKRLLK